MPCTGSSWPSKFPTTWRRPTSNAKGCLDLAAAAVRQENALVIAHACALVDDVVTRLADSRVAYARSL